MSTDRDYRGKTVKAPQVGLEPTTLRLTVGAEAFAGQGLHALQRENAGQVVLTHPRTYSASPAISRESHRPSAHGIMRTGPRGYGLSAHSYGAPRCASESTAAVRSLVPRVVPSLSGLVHWNGAA